MEKPLKRKKFISERQSRGKRGKMSFLEYEVLKEVLTKVEPMLSTRKQYRAWVDVYEVMFAPKYPDKVYAEWTGWGDFLPKSHNKRSGGDVMYRKLEYLPFSEAIREAQLICIENGIENGSAWRRYYKGHREEMISRKLPRDPQRLYAEWVELGGSHVDKWGVWCGLHIADRVRVASMGDSVVALCRSNMRSGNILEYIVCEGGYTQLVDILGERGDLEVFRLYYWEDGVIGQFVKLMEYFGSLYEDSNVYLFVNVNELMFELDNLMRVYNKPVNVTR